MNQLKLLLVPIFTAVLALNIACNKDENDNSPARKKFGIFKVQDDNRTAIMDGEINDKSLNKYNDMIAAYPDLDKINIAECGGSSDDEINLQLSLKVYQKGIEIHLNDDGMIASGGVDFFLAGVKRTKGSNTRIGVHSWSGDDDDGNEVKATDFPRGHANHQPYIDYYVSIGFTQQEAEDFYYFTINAAPPEDVHWMTDEEIEQYGILK